jgi:hypothetical protein
MAAISLFWYTNMAAVTSDENDLYNGFYYSEIAFIGFTLHEIKQGIVFFGTPGILYVRHSPVFASQESVGKNMAVMMTNYATDMRHV